MHAQITCYETLLSCSYRSSGSRYYHSTDISQAAGVLTLRKGLLAVPFVLHSQPTAVFEENAQTVHQQASVAQRRYAEIMRDVEDIINDHSELGLTSTA
jgi:hypothetical protein